MAEVARVLREMQFDNEGGLVPASGLRRRAKLVVKDDSAAVHATKADRKVAAVAGNKAGKGMMKASSWSDFGIGTNLAVKSSVAPEPEGKPVPLAVKKPAPEEYFAVKKPALEEEDLAVKKPAPEEEDLAVKKPAPEEDDLAVNKPAPEEEDLAVNKPAPEEDLAVNKPAPEEDLAVKKPASEEEEDKLAPSPVLKKMVPVSSFNNLKTLPNESAPEEEHKPDDLSPVLKERVPQYFIDHLKRKPFKRLRPLPDDLGVWDSNSRFVQNRLSLKSLVDAIVDLQEDILCQERLKGYAEVGVDYTEGIKRVFIIPH